MGMCVALASLTRSCAGCAPALRTRTPVAPTVSLASVAVAVCAPLCAGRDSRRRQWRCAVCPLVEQPCSVCPRGVESVECRLGAAGVSVARAACGCRGGIGAGVLPQDAWGGAPHYCRRRRRARLWWAPRDVCSRQTPADVCVGVGRGTSRWRLRPHSAQGVTPRAPHTQLSWRRRRFGCVQCAAGRVACCPRMPMVLAAALGRTPWCPRREPQAGAHAVRMHRAALHVLGTARVGAAPMVSARGTTAWPLGHDTCTVGVASRRAHTSCACIACGVRPHHCRLL